MAASIHNKSRIDEKRAQSLHRKQVMGAWSRLGGALAIWLTLLLGWVSGTFTTESFIWMTSLAAGQLMINLPFVFILKRVRDKDKYEYISLFTNIIEMTCYTGIVYFAGGLHAGHMLLIFAGLIAFVGVAAPRRITVAVAVIAIFEYNLMLALEHFGILPHQNFNAEYHYTLLDTQTIGITASGLFGVVAYIAITTGTSLRANRNNLRRRNQELDRINKIVNIANRTLDLNTILTSMCKELTALFPIRYAAIGLMNNEVDILKVVAFHTVDETMDDLTGFEMPMDTFAATRKVVENPEPLFIEDADTNPLTMQLHEHFKQFDMRSMLIAPLLSRGKVIGSIGMPALDPDYHFTQEDHNLIQTIAAQVAAAINNAQLYARTESALGVAERDLQIGREIQTGFLPETLPVIENWELSSLFVPAREVAGDFYDAFSLEEEGKIVFVIGDVCDKGVGAALFMVVFRSLIRSFCLSTPVNNQIDDYLQGIVDTVNNYIAGTHDKANMFATLFIGLIDTEDNSLHYINAGHEVPIIANELGEIKQTLDPTGPAMGMIEDMVFTVGSCELASGDTLLAYTDGVLDARNSAGDSYSEERLFKAVGQPMVSALSLISEVERRITTHINQTAQFDDIAMIAVRRSDTRGDQAHLLTMSARLEELPVMRRFIERAADQLQLDESQVYALQLSSDEIVTNIISHGKLSAGSELVRLQVRATESYVDLVIEDEGEEFDSSVAPEIDIDQEAEDRDIGGLGLFMVQEMMDEVRYARLEKRVNQITLRKNRSEGAPDVHQD